MLQEKRLFKSTENEHDQTPAFTLLKLLSDNATTPKKVQNTQGKSCLLLKMAQHGHASSLSQVKNIYAASSASEWLDHGPVDKHNPQSAQWRWDSSPESDLCQAEIGHKTQGTRAAPAPLLIQFALLCPIFHLITFLSLIRGNSIKSSPTPQFSPSWPSQHLPGLRKIVPATTSDPIPAAPQHAPWLWYLPASILSSWLKAIPGFHAPPTTHLGSTVWCTLPALLKTLFPRQTNWK